MTTRKNESYVITDTISISRTEFVIGENQTSLGTQYVTWACKNGDSYFWGHYFDTRRDAERDLVNRAGEELSLLAAIESRQEHGAKKQDRGDVR